MPGSPYPWWHHAWRAPWVGRGGACRRRAGRRWRSGRRRCRWRRPAGRSMIAEARWICARTATCRHHAQPAGRGRVRGRLLWRGVAQPAFAAARSPRLELLMQPMCLLFVHCRIDTAHSGVSQASRICCGRGEQSCRILMDTRRDWQSLVKPLDVILHRRRQQGGGTCGT